MVQEAVRDSIRHGHPTRIGIELRGGTPLTIEIVDDGSGIPEAALAKSTGGLQNLRRRAEALGGVLTIASGGPGSRVEIRLPG